KKDDADKSGGEKRVLKFDSFSGGNGEEVWKDLEAAFEKKYPEVDVQMRFEKDLPAVLNKENATGTYSDLVYYNVGQKSGFTESQLNSGE
ncbi:carbohydrate ABC transporter substrate-binding protein, partial [Megasphaera massiliensis]|nr:carbohydrate ABC transporter substrate-binding protein [Megasphaera massiliensis]